MGFYDGIATSERASAYDLAVQTKTPAVLVLDGRGSALSLAGHGEGLSGLPQSQPPSGACSSTAPSPPWPSAWGRCCCGRPGCRCWAACRPWRAAALRAATWGWSPPGRFRTSQQKLDRLADAAEESVDLDAILELAREAPEVKDKLKLPKGATGGKVKIAVARDEAFCFYYESSLRILRSLGATLVAFSPLHDKKLPKGVCGLYLGGGYPELHAEALAMNHAMRESVRAAVAAGMPTVAECGGFLYLQRTLQGTRASTPG